MKKFFVFIWVCSFSTSCGMFDGLERELIQFREQAVLALNDGINSLENESKDWQFVLSEVTQKIDGQIEATLTYNIPYIMDRANRLLLSNVLCVKESIKDEVVYYLKLARAELLTGEKPPLPPTKICLTSIPALDLNAPVGIRTLIIYTGIFIHTKDSIRAVLSNVNQKLELPTERLDFTDISTITLSLYDLKDDFLGKYTHLKLYYNNKLISSMAVIKKAAAPPLISVAQTNITNIVWIPPLLRSDTEFDGHGPIMISHVKLKHDGTRAFAQIYLYAEELKPNSTLAAGWSNWVQIYTAPSGYKINKFLEPVEYLNLLRGPNRAEYIDRSWEDHIIETVVGRAILVGDTKGGEAGYRTKITLDLRAFSLEIQKL